MYIYLINYTLNAKKTKKQNKKKPPLTHRESRSESAHDIYIFLPHFHFQQIKELIRSYN